MSFRAFHADHLKGAHALVLGDVILDTFVFGKVNRISPEAPIPVLLSHSVKTMLGGAGNVAANLAALGCAPVVVGVVGDDAEGREVRTLMEQARHPIAHHLFVDSARPTTVKTRFTAGAQQILRVDREMTTTISQETEDRLLSMFHQALEGAKVVALSDYGKGVLTDRIIGEAIRMARARGIPVIVDPKRADFSIYHGASYIKPNLPELSKATALDCSSEEEIAAAAARVQAATGADVVVTRSQQGMSLFEAGRPPQHVRSSVREVYDVSGAGDSALAAFAAALAGGYNARDAMHIANATASIAVAKLGTAVVTIEELSSTLNESEFLLSRGNVLNTDQVRALAEIWRQRGLRVGFANGCFDIIHAGHVSLLATAECDRLIVGLNSDESVRRLKGPTRPVQSEKSRAQVLGSLDTVDAVVIFNENTPLELIKAIRPDVLIKGADYREDQVVGGDFVKSYGGRVHLAPLVEGQSTTSVVKRMTANQTGG